MPAEIELLEQLVAIRSVSGSEQAIAEFVEGTAQRWNLAVERDDTSVRVEVKGRREGPTLALVSHLDTVPPGSGWSRDPFVPSTEGTRLYGRGSGDAKASVAAMLCAARDVADAGGTDTGRLLVVLGYGEETKNTTMEQAVERIGSIDAAVVGEPTNLDIAIAQRGLMMVDLIAEGDQRHAGYAADGGFTNAVAVLAQDLLKLPSLFADRPHQTLGVTMATPTMLEAGVSRNVTPPVAKAVLDVRSTPAWTHEEIAVRLRESLLSRVVVTSRRLVPCETPPGSRVLAAARRARPEAACFGSPTCSDWVFLRDADAIKCGPGTSRRSHTPDEYVDLPEVTAGRTFYAKLAQVYLGAA
ncbi:MAG TPA: M20/M25/M40 family metallo-hydrolase [Gemmatimonadales bacterium]